MDSSKRAYIRPEWDFEKKAEAFIERWGRNTLVDAVRIPRNPTNTFCGWYIIKKVFVDEGLGKDDERRMLNDAVTAGISETPYGNMTEQGWELACKLASEKSPQ